MGTGARKTTVMEEPLAAAIGAGLDIAASNGSMVVDMGGGTTDVAVLSLSGVVISESLRIGSNTFDEAIIRYLEKIKHVAIGQHTAEELKILIGTAMGDGRRMTADVRGRSTETGLPTSVDIDSQGNPPGPGRTDSDRPQDDRLHPGKDTARTGCGHCRPWHRPYRRRPAPWIVSTASFPRRQAWPPISAMNLCCASPTEPVRLAGNGPLKR